MPLYELLHVATGMVYLIFGGLASFYAIKTLAMLYRSPEMLKTQQGILLPILIGTLFFAAAGIFHLANHTFYPDPLIDLLHELAIVLGVSAFTVSVLRYSQLQREYYTLRHRGLEQIRLEDQLQVETQ